MQVIKIDQLRTERYVPYPRAPLTGVAELGLRALRSKLMAEKIRAAARAKLAAQMEKIIFDHLSESTPPFFPAL